ncbi:hypothetical protein DNTS_002218, partial [Danionella cerebrum]
RSSKSKRVFINNVDKYTSKNIAKFLASCVPGASLVAHGEDDDADDDEMQQEDGHAKIILGTFQIVGTVSSPGEKCSFIAEEYCNLKREDLFQQLMKCDVIIYDVTQYAEQEFPDIPLSDKYYRRRRAHPNFLDHVGLEKLVVKLGKKKSSLLSTYVVASGLQYGMGEQVFHLFFKMSWVGDVPHVPIFGDGSNILPTIHINDLAGIIQNIIDRKPALHYFVAADDSKNTLEEIIKAISLMLGPGKTENVLKEEIYLKRDLTQTDIDSLLINLRMEAVYVRENFNIQWVSGSGMVENMEQITEEYKQSRGLLPLRICILGPPAIGKTTIAERICKLYKLHHVKLKDTINETFEDLEMRVGKEEEEETDASEAQGFLEALREDINENGQLVDQNLIRIMRDKLTSKPCMKQGFVLDGFPKTFEQAKELFTNDEESEESQPANFIPEFLFSLDATDDFLKNRVLNLPEAVVEGTSYAPELFLQRLNKFRQRNVEDKTPLNYFEDLLILPEYLDDVEEEKRREIKKQMKQRALKRAETERQEEEEARLREQRWGEWSEQLLEVRRQEYGMLDSMSEPLRLYLMKEVMPTLSQGLIECCRTRPDDPIDFLAEFLLQNNPQA